MKALQRVAVVIAAVTLLARIAAAEGLRKIWDFRTGDGVRNQTEGSAGAPSVFALSFSPDGQRIAAVVGRSPLEEFVLILDVRDPEANKQRLEVNPKMWVGDRVSWSPSGQQILLNRTIIDVSNGSACSLPEEARITGLGFIGRTEVAGRVWEGQSKPMRLSFFDLDCHPTRQVDLGSDWWQIDDIDAERGLLLIAEQRGRTGISIYNPASVEGVVSLMDAESKKIIREWKWSEGNRFADHGKAACSALGANWHRAVQCLDLDTGKQLATTTGWTDLDFQTALHGTRVVLSDYGRVFDWGDFVWLKGSLKTRAVWDFGTRKELASWRPKSQTVYAGVSPHELVPYEFAISPDGEYLVEGGAGTLSLYKVGQ